MVNGAAIKTGYTVEVEACSGEGLDLHLLIRPDTNTDDQFRAWDCDAQEWLLVSGWLFTFEPIDAD